MDFAGDDDAMAVVPIFYLLGPKMGGGVQIPPPFSIISHLENPTGVEVLRLLRLLTCFFQAQ